VLPELSGDQRSDLVPLVLGPPASEHSSLWHMVATCGRALFAQAPRYFLPASGLDWAGFQDALETGDAACVIATDLALDAWLAGAESHGFAVALPQGSRVMHTGGPKGMRRAIPTEALHERIANVLGVPASH